MNVTFYGATREVTGSMHMINTKKDRILLDCGLYQGRRQEAKAKNKSFPFDTRIITNMVLSHAHIDHSGRIPFLTSKDFNGRIVCSTATQDACKPLLADSAHIQESDAAYLNYKAARAVLTQKEHTNKEKQDIQKILKNNGHRLNLEVIDELAGKYRLEKIEPLYTSKDAEDAMSQFDGIPYEQTVDIAENTVCTLYDAGHILGSAFSVIRHKVDGKQLKVCFTGDIGRFNKPIINDPTLIFAEEDRDIDLLIMESTYGNRFHEPAGDMKSQLAIVINQAVEKKGTILIPAFSYGRTQELLYLLHELYNENSIPKLPVYVDSPLSSKITRVFGEHPEVYDKDTHKTFLEKGENPFAFAQLKFVESVEESMALNRDQSPHIVIASSGMCEAGRILHHLRHKIHSESTTILFVGFMAQHTLGRRLQEKGAAYKEAGRIGKPPVQRFLNKEYPLNAHVEVMNGFSAHADQSELLKFLKTSNLRVKRIAVVHGEEQQSLTFSEKLQAEGFDAFVPYTGETVRV